MPVFNSQGFTRWHLPRLSLWTSYCSLLLIYLPQKDERLSRPRWLTYSGWFTHISGHPSAAGWQQNRESSVVEDRRSTTAARNQPAHVYVYLIWAVGSWCIWCMSVCMSTDEKQLFESQQQEVDALQHKVTSLRTELKTEMKHVRQLNEAHVRQFLFCLCYFCRLFVVHWLSL